MEPKLARNWRSFLKEFGVIVLGVSVALAAQQAADWLRWQGEVKAARRAIHAEMTANNIYFLRRVSYGLCLDRQAGEAEAILDNLTAKRPPGRFTAFHVGAHTLLNESDWQSERAAQSLTHFPRAELAQIGTYYGLLSVMRVWLDQEADAWRALSVLRRPDKDIAAGELLRLRQSLATARWTASLMVLNARRQLTLSRRLGIADPPLDRQRMEKYCNTDEEAWMQYLQSLEPAR